MHPPPSPQPGLILPSWLNVRQKAAVATLCTLWNTLYSTHYSTHYTVYLYCRSNNLFLLKIAFLLIWSCKPMENNGKKSHYNHCKKCAKSQMKYLGKWGLSCVNPSFAKKGALRVLCCLILCCNAFYGCDTGKFDFRIERWIVVNRFLRSGDRYGFGTPFSWYKQRKNPRQMGETKPSRRETQMTMETQQ